MDLHNKIVNIQVNKRHQNKAIDAALKKYKSYRDVLVAVYQSGYRDARRVAVDLSAIHSIETGLKELEERDREKE